MDPWINNIPVFGQSGTLVYRQLGAYSDPNASQQHPGASNYIPFAPLYQPGLTVYNTASSNENQSDSSSPSLCEPAGRSTRSDDITAQKKMCLKEEVICLIETYAKKKDDFRNPRMRNIRRRDMSLVMQSLARPSSRISKDHILHALITTRKQEMIERNVLFMMNLTAYCMEMTT